MKKGIKITAAALAVLASAGATGYYANINKANADDHASTVEPRTVSAVTSETRTASSEKAQKDETVYVLSDANGNVNKTIVSDWLKNTGALKSIDDISNLSDIVNVKGSQAYTADGDSVLWDAQGSDIYYRGTTDKQVPVTMKVTYTLDGKEIKPEDLAGKSGHIKIRYDYTNNEKRSTIVGDSKEDLYVPYLLSTVTSLDSDKFTNIELSNGKVLSDGSKVMVMGVAFPGLKESLNLKDDADVDIPDYFEIEADVTEFEMETSVTVASSEIFSELDIDTDSTVDDLKDSIKQLSDASEELCDGTKSLYDGINELSDGTGSLTDGIDQLANGVTTLNTGAASLTSGADQVNAGAASLADGASALSTGADSLVSGAGELSAGLDSLNTNMKSAKTGADQLAAGSGQLVDGVGKVSAGLTQTAGGLTELSDGIDTAAAALQTSIQYEETEIAKILTVHPDYATGAPASGDKTEADWVTFSNLYASVQYQKSVYASMTTVPEAEDAKTIKKGIVALQAGNTKLSDGVSDLSDGIDQVHTGAVSLQNGLGQLAAGSEKLNTGATALYSGAQQASAGVKQLSDGANQVAAGTSQVSGGAKQLADGTSQLVTGATALRNGGKTLTSGVAQLKDGASQLNDGMNEFNETGIQKLSEAINGDLSGYLDCFKALKNLSADYGTFSGVADNMDGKVTFIYTTDSILSE